MSMHYLGVHASNGTVVLHGKSETTVRIIGSSCISTGVRYTKPDSYGEMTASFGPLPNGVGAVIAFIITHPPAGRGIININESAVMKVGWSGDMIFLDTDHHFTSEHCSLTVGKDRCLELIVPGEGRFVHDPTGKMDNKDARYVDNPDILCQFANGGIDINTLNSMVGVDSRTATEIQLQYAQRRISLLESEMDRKNSDFEISRKGLAASEVKSRGIIELKDFKISELKASLQTSEAKVEQLRVMRANVLKTLIKGTWGTRIKRAVHELVNNQDV